MAAPNNNAVQNCQLTDYPNIYKRTSWGHKFGNESLTDPTIVHNRNRFVADFNISRHAVNKHTGYFLQTMMATRGIGMLFDHSEVYTTTTGEYLILVSPYGCKNAKLAELCGFEPVYDLYSNSASSFVKIGRASEFEPRAVALIRRNLHARAME